MFKEKSNQDETKKIAPKKGDSAQPKENNIHARLDVNIKGGATKDKCVVRPVVMRAQDKSGKVTS